MVEGISYGLFMVKFHYVSPALRMYFMNVSGPRAYLLNWHFVIGNFEMHATTKLSSSIITVWVILSYWQFKRET